MVRAIITFGVAAIFITLAIAEEVLKPYMTTIYPKNRKVLADIDNGYDYKCNDCYGNACCCKCSCRAPEVTVHVIQPPPTYIYDVTQTAKYWDYCDDCGRRVVCGPTCLPQGEVLAPCHTGKNVAICPKPECQNGPPPPPPGAHPHRHRSYGSRN